MNAPVTPRERPILFSGEMVRAILDGKKTQTRRPVKPQPSFRYPGTARLVYGVHPMSPSMFEGTPAEGLIGGKDRMGWLAEDWCGNVVGEAEADAFRCPYGAPGDRLWVRETWAPHEPHPCSTDIPGRGPEVRYEDLSPTQRAYWARRVIHRATATADDASSVERWRPSIFMPRWASRILLDVLSVRVERVQDISEKDILAEGVTVPIVSKMTGIEWAEIPDLYTAWRLGWTHIYGAESWGANPWIWVVEFRRVENAHGR